MASPITIGTTATVVVPINKRRSIIRFQNVGNTTIYVKKVPIEGLFTRVSHTDFEAKLLPTTSDDAGGDAFETNSIASFMFISSAANGSVAIYETIKL